MGKRASIDADGAAAFRKRQKITHDVPTGEDVSSGEQLRGLLAFDQDMRRARHGEFEAPLNRYSALIICHHVVLMAS